MNTYRAGIIGCGKIASEFADDPKMEGDIFTHAEAYSHCPETNLVAICDSDPNQLAKCGQRWGIQARYTDLKEMIAHEDLDILSVCTPDSTHAEVIKTVLSEPRTIKAILCEKPLATSVETAHELIALSQLKAVILAVMYMRRHARNYQALKEFLSSNQLGRIQAIAGWYTKGVRHNGTHWFDSVRHLAGEVTWVMAWDRLQDSQDDPTLDVVLGLENGSIASLRACDANFFTIFEMEILASLGRVRLLDSGFQIETSKVIDSKRYTGYKELEVIPVPFGDRKNLMAHAVEDLVEALQTGKPVACSGVDGLAALCIADGAIQSARSGKMVHLDGQEAYRWQE
jgi:predicted dehydrogenase